MNFRIQVRKMIWASTRVHNANREETNAEAPLLQHPARRAANDDAHVERNTSADAAYLFRPLSSFLRRQNVALRRGLPRWRLEG